MFNFVLFTTIPIFDLKEFCEKKKLENTRRIGESLFP